MGINVAVLCRYLCRNDKVLHDEEADKSIDESGGSPNIGESGIEQDEIT
jgi:hypothetical protein